MQWQFGTDRLCQSCDTNVLNQQRVDTSAGANVSMTISFEPTSTTGSLSALLRLVHSAPNEPSPFRLNLSGTSTP